MRDGLTELRFYQMSLELWDKCWSDNEIIDDRCQLIDSITAMITKTIQTLENKK